jgi:signal transduction histidine kinase
MTQERNAQPFIVVIKIQTLVQAMGGTGLGLVLCKDFVQNTDWYHYC